MTHIPPVTVNVGLGERAYDIHIGPGLLRTAGEMLAPLLPRPRTLIVTDENVAALHLETLKASLARAGIRARTVIFPPGEATKSFENLRELTGKILASGLERSDFVIAFGGGVIGDLTGFAAAIARRGMGFVQIPTTLLAQVDSSVGGKTGVNSEHGKNLIGAFHQPAMVIADTEVLNTLDRRELLAGYAEVVKYGLLGDADFFAWLEKNAQAVLDAEPAARIRAIRTSCEAKAAIVARDEREGSVRALLNLGHTFGHGLEAALGYGGTLLHGEAVAIGTVQAFRFSGRQGLCPPGRAERIEAHFRAIGLPVDMRAIQGALPPAKELVSIMSQDKKARRGELVFILAHDIGEAFIAPGVDTGAVEDFLRRELEETA